MPLHESTFQYLKPTDEQITKMAAFRETTHAYASLIDQGLPDGADKTYILRKIREIAMWINVSITREADGTPRQ